MRAQFRHRDICREVVEAINSRPSEDLYVVRWRRGAEAKSLSPTNKGAADDFAERLRARGVKCVVVPVKGGANG